MTSRSARRSESRVTLLRAALVFVVLLAPARALPQAPDALQLAWSAPAGCPDADAVRARVRRLLGKGKRIGGPPLRVDGTITRGSAGALQLRLVVHRGELVGERHIEGRSCRDLAASAAVALALQLRGSEPLVAPDHDESSATAAGERSSESEPRSSAVAAPSVSPDPPVITPSARVDVERALRSRRLRALVQLPVGALAVGPLRAPSFGLGAAAGVEHGRWRALLDARAWLPKRLTIEREPERYAVDVRRFSAGLRGCAAFVWARVEAAPCALLSIEHFSATGSGPQIVERTARATWIAPGIGAQLRVHLATWSRLVVGADVQLHTARPTLRIDGVGSLERLSLLGAVATLAAEWNL